MSRPSSNNANNTKKPSKDKTSVGRSSSTTSSTSLSSTSSNRSNTSVVSVSDHVLFNAIEDLKKGTKSPDDVMVLFTMTIGEGDRKRPAYDINFRNKDHLTTPLHMIINYFRAKNPEKLEENLLKIINAHKGFFKEDNILQAEEILKNQDPNNEILFAFRYMREDYKSIAPNIAEDYKLSDAEMKINDGGGSAVVNHASGLQGEEKIKFLLACCKERISKSYFTEGSAKIFKAVGDLYREKDNLDAALPFYTAWLEITRDFIAYSKNKIGGIDSKNKDASDYVVDPAIDVARSALVIGDSLSQIPDKKDAAIKFYENAGKVLNLAASNVGADKIGEYNSLVTAVREKLTPQNDVWPASSN